ncbi:MAG: NAD(P)-binding protein [Ruminococcaceae bacterium]|nr:NAD(P)-binding protein [Oscillospiraceae bacterium]
MEKDFQKLNNLAKTCVQSEAPHCVAACPMHVDIKALCRAVATGDFTAGRRLLEKTLPFAGLICRVCEAPCTGRCLRNTLDSSVQVRALERACMDRGGAPQTTGEWPEKQERVAVVGSGPAGLYAAATLLQKGYSVALFESADALGGSLRGDDRVRDVLAGELQAIATAQTMCNIVVGQDVSVDDLLGQFDAVCLCWGRGQGAEKPEDFDAFTFQHKEKKNLFCAGCMLGGNYTQAIYAAESGQRAARSIERVFQKVSVSAARTGEGVYDSKLYTNLAEEPSVQPLPLADDGTFSAGDAQSEAARCLQCQCLECTKNCTYLQHYKQYSGSAIRPIIKNINIMTGWGTRDANNFIYDCALCGLCGSCCPVDIDLGGVNLPAREFMWETHILPPAVHAFPLRDMEYSVDDMRLARNQQGFEQSRYALFTGCQLPASMPASVEKLYAHLAQSLDGGVGLLTGCCGAPAIWAGREEQAAAVRGTLRADWEALGRPELIVACPGCYKVLNETLPDIPLRFVAEVLAGHLPAGAGVAPGQYAYHDPCTSRHYAGLQQSGRQLAAACGAQVAELPQHREHTVCCGYGGLQYHVNQPLARKTTGARISQSPLPYVTSCSNCRDFFATGGKTCLHLLELVFGAEESKGSSPFAEIDFSKRRAQRRALNRRLLKAFWGETVREEDAGVTVIISDALREKLNRQHILEDDVVNTLQKAEASGRRMLEKATGHHVAYHREGYVTFWFEYTLEAGRVVLQNAYSHRMQIVEKV